MDLTDIKGIGPARMKKLSAVGIFSLRDLLYSFPLRYEDHETLFPCSTSCCDSPVMIQGQISRAPILQRFHGLTKVSCQIQDASGMMPLQWFNCPWIMNTVKPGQKYRLYGRVIIKDERRYLLNPRFIDDSGWIPVYRAIPGLPQKSYRKLVERATDHINEIHPEYFPAEFRERHELCSAEFAFREIHFPTRMENIKAAKKRISFEQMLLYMIRVSCSAGEKKKSYVICTESEQLLSFWRAMPFQPTSAQQKVLTEIAEDLSKKHAMRRLVQGDVGCGKTVIAFGSIYIVCRNGFQSAMMAPTEILAVQHYEAARSLLSPFGIRCRLLTGATSDKNRKEILNELSDGTCDAIFGTQALISKTVKYRRLGLVITDEQHRFGVSQRTALENKGTDSDSVHPHVLVMSATPIPRSLALILYGDLDLSVVDELPAGRKPVKTRIIKENKRSDLYRYLYREIRAGKQAYIVCPKVDEDTDNDEESALSDGASAVRSAKGVYDELLREGFDRTETALIWGTQKTDEKNKTIQNFKEGITKVLVATTVVEVGVNNPNATIMIIENAERFGLSQLHQLRGRVGRGQLESWCFLVTEKEDAVRILQETNDGFRISEKDLEKRGPGEIIGTKQAGHLMENDVFNNDFRLLDEVTRSVKDLQKRDDPSDKHFLSTLKVKASAYFQNQEIGIN